MLECETFGSTEVLFRYTLASISLALRVIYPVCHNWKFYSCTTASKHKVGMIKLRLMYVKNLFSSSPPCPISDYQCMMGESTIIVINIQKYDTNGMIRLGTFMLQTDFFTRQIHLQHASITWWDGKRNTGYLHVISSADIISMLTSCVCVCVCRWCLLSTWNRTMTAAQAAFLWLPSATDQISAPAALSKVCV